MKILNTLNTGRLLLRLAALLQWLLKKKHQDFPLSVRGRSVTDFTFKGVNRTFFIKRFLSLLLSLRSYHQNHNISSEMSPDDALLKVKYS